MMRLPAMRGFTLVEMMVTIAVVAILAMIAAPSFNNLFDKYRVKRAAEMVSAFLVNTKTEAIKRNKTVSAVITGSGSTWCVGMTETNTCNCSTVGACQIDGVDRVISSTSFKGVGLDGPTTGHAFKFKPQRGTVSGNETVELESADGLKINVVIGTFGRIRLCSPSGSGNVGGYPVCS
jgi:prepilin-type N-terminal cleavage/methylation domain-containing protein